MYLPCSTLHLLISHLQKFNVEEKIKEKIKKIKTLASPTRLWNFLEAHHKLAGKEKKIWKNIITFQCNHVHGKLWVQLSNHFVGPLIAKFFDCLIHTHTHIYIYFILFYIKVGFHIPMHSRQINDKNVCKNTKWAFYFPSV